MKSERWFSTGTLTIAWLVAVAQSSPASINIINPTGANYRASEAVTDLVPPFPIGTTGTVKLNPLQVGHLESPTVGSDFDTAFTTDSVPINPTHPGFSGWTWTAGSDQGLNG